MHKIDAYSDDQRIECQREIQNLLSDELATSRVTGAKVGAAEPPRDRLVTTL